MVMVSPTCTSTDLSGFNDYFFRTVPNDEVAAKSLLGEVDVNSQQVSVAYVHSSEYATSFKESFEEGLANQKYLHTCDSIDSFKDESQAKQCATEAQEQGADFLLLVPTSKLRQVTLPILKHLDNEITPLGSDSVYGPEVIQDYGKEAAESGLKLYVSWIPDPNPEKRTVFEEKATQLFDADGWNWRYPVYL